MPRPQVETLNFWSASFWTMIDMMIRSVGSGSSANQGADWMLGTKPSVSSSGTQWRAAKCRPEDILEKMVPCGTTSLRRIWRRRRASHRPSCRVECGSEKGVGVGRDRQGHSRAGASDSEEGGWVVHWKGEPGGGMCVAQ